MACNSKGGQPSKPEETGTAEETSRLSHYISEASLSEGTKQMGEINLIFWPLIFVLYATFSFFFHLQILPTKEMTNCT